SLQTSTNNHWRPAKICFRHRTWRIWSAGFRAERDVIQIDPPQAYGIGQYVKTIEMLASRGWRRTSLFPHGGNQMALAIAAGFGLGAAESYPGAFGDFGGVGGRAPVPGGPILLFHLPRDGLQ